jgi:hypothetical protein
MDTKSFQFERLIFRIFRHFCPTNNIVSPSPYNTNVDGSGVTVGVQFDAPEIHPASAPA